MLSTQSAPSDPQARAAAEAGGVIGSLIEHFTRSAARPPPPALALAAALSAVAVLAGRRFRTETGLGGALLVISAGPPGCCDRLAGALRHLIEAAGLECFLGGDGLATRTGLLAELTEHPARLFALDDFARLATVGQTDTGEGSALWSAIGLAHLRAQGTLRDPGRTGTIQQPCLCVNGLIDIAGCAGLVGAVGLPALARFMLFASPHRLPRRRIPPEPAVDAAPDLARRLRVLAGPTPMRSDARAEPVCVRSTPSARALHDRRLARADAHAASVAGLPAALPLERLDDNAERLALLRAVSRVPAAPVITASDVAWGWDLAEACAAELITRAGPAARAGDQQAERLLALLREAGGAGLTRSALYRRAAFLGQRREAVLAALAAAGRITVERVSGRSRPATRYRLRDG